MKAWTTLLTQPNYLAGVRVLRASLERCGSRFPLVVLVTENIDESTRRGLETDGCLIREAAPIRPPQDLESNYANARFGEVWTKLAAWSLTEFELVAFLDADMLVVQNMDELLSIDLPPRWVAASNACLCNPNKIPTYPPDWTPDHCAYTYAINQATPAEAANYFNAGLVILRPDAEVFADFLAGLADTKDLSRYSFAEQDFLNDYFRARWQRLPYIYNALKTLQFQHADLWDIRDVKNIHYIIDKPWDSALDPGDRYYPIEKLWWDVAGTVDKAARVSP